MTLDTELESLEFLCARWAVELVDLQLKTRPDRMPGNEALARWRHLYKMPNGRRVPTSTELPLNSHAAYLDMLKRGCRFEAEMLMTGQVSVTISDPKEEIDVDIEVISNGPDVQKAMVTMLNRRLWREIYDAP